MWHNQSYLKKTTIHLQQRWKQTNKIQNCKQPTATRCNAIVLMELFLLQDKHWITSRQRAKRFFLVASTTQQNNAHNRSKNLMPTTRWQSIRCGTATKLTCAISRNNSAQTLCHNFEFSHGAHCPSSRADHFRNVPSCVMGKSELTQDVFFVTRKTQSDISWILSADRQPWINKNCNDVWLLQGRKLVFYDFLVLPQNKHTRMFPWSEEEQILTSISLPCNIFIVSLKTKRRMQASLAFALMLFCSMNQTRESLWQRKNISRALIRNFLQTPKHLTQFAENENTWCELTPDHALALKAKTTLNYCDWQLIT